jgi:transcriptional regulator with XRE-family HTH domain
MKTLGQHIRELRDKKDLSLRDLAEKLDCSAAFLSDIELGKRFPSSEMLTKIAKALSVKRDDLEKYDIRSDIEEFKKNSQSNPNYAFAFRKMVDKNISPEEVLEMLKKLDSKK